MTLSQKKKYLESYGDMIDREKELTEELQSIKQTPMPCKRDSSGEQHMMPLGSLTEAQAVRIKQIEDNLRTLRYNAPKRRRAIDKKLDRMECKRYAEVLRIKYLWRWSPDRMLVWSGITPGGLDKALDKAIDNF